MLVHMSLMWFILLTWFSMSKLVSWIYFFISCYSICYIFFWTGEKKSPLVQIAGFFCLIVRTIVSNWCLELSDYIFSSLLDEILEEFSFHINLFYSILFMDRSSVLWNGHKLLFILTITSTYISVNKKRNNLSSSFYAFFCLFEDGCLK